MALTNRCPSSSFTQDERKINEIPLGEKEEVLLSGGNGFVDADSLALCQNATCYLYYDYDLNGTSTRKNATGFFAHLRIENIDYNVIVTNNHMISSKEAASKATAKFFYEGNSQGIDARILPDKIFETNKDLDYTIMGCEDELILKMFKIRPIQLVDEGFVSPNEEVYIFQHPRGGKKQMSHNTISCIERPFVYYNADTDIGSSGSCVLRRVENTLKLLAIHCKGSDADRYNKGVLCSEIIRHVNTGQYTKPNILPPTSLTRNYTYIDSMPESPTKKKFFVDVTESPVVKKKYLPTTDNLLETPKTKSISTADCSHNIRNGDETKISEDFLNDISQGFRLSRRSREIRCLFIQMGYLVLIKQSQ